MRAAILGVAIALVAGACASEDPIGPEGTRELPVAGTPDSEDADVPGTAVAPVSSSALPHGMVWKVIPVDRAPEPPKPDPPGPHW
jgi:hypothetical protein